MRTLADLARKRIVTWMEANPHLTQEIIAREIGVSQAWVSQYKSGDQDADIDQLDALARAFGHTLMELIDLRPDPKEREMIDAYRQLRPEARAVAVLMLKTMAPPPPARKRSRARNGER